MLGFYCGRHDRSGLRELHLPRCIALRLGLIPLIKGIHCSKRRVAPLHRLAIAPNSSLVERISQFEVLKVIRMPVSYTLTLKSLLLLLDLAEIASVLVLLA